MALDLRKATCPYFFQLTVVIESGGKFLFSGQNYFVEKVTLDGYQRQTITQTIQVGRKDITLKGKVLSYYQVWHQSTESLVFFVAEIIGSTMMADQLVPIEKIHLEKELKVQPRGQLETHVQHSEFCIENALTNRVEKNVSGLDSVQLSIIGEDDVTLSLIDNDLRDIHYSLTLSTEKKLISVHLIDKAGNDSLKNPT